MTDVKFLAEEQLRLLGGEQYPVPVIALAEQHHIHVFTSEDFLKDENGYISMENGNAKIVVNGTHSYGRKRFTIAHEIAHYLLDRDYLLEHGSIDRDGTAADPSYRSRETRANIFAAELLMPEQPFVDQWLVLKDIERIADYFGVSKSAAQWRAKNLGLIEAQ